MQFVMTHGYGVIVLFVLLDQLGFPLPSIPILVVAGAMTGMDEFTLPRVLAASTLACLPSDLLWFELGRRRGGSVLKTVCRLSLEPDSCVSNTRSTFERYGVKSLIFAKLIPGYQTLSPALAGMTGMSRLRFFAWDIPGAFVWSAAFVLPGALFRNQVEHALDFVKEFGETVGLVAVLGAVGWVAWKFFHRQRFIRSLRVARLDPEELKALLDQGGAIAIIDLRDAMSLQYQPLRIPGATVIEPDELEHRHEEIPRDRDVVLYCT